MKQIQAVVMIALIVLSSGQLWAGGGRATGRAIGGANVGVVPGAVSPRGWPSGVIVTPSYFFLASCRPTPIPIISHPL